MTAERPLVSILVPTRDRREFIPILLQWIDAQTWPADAREIIVVDDGRDAVGDLFEGRDDVTYEHLDTRVPLGTKRNRLSELASGEIHVCFDDDDIHPPDRIERAVAALADEDVEVVGRSDLAFWDVDTGAIHLQPVVGKKHATAGSMAFKAAYWQEHRWAPDPHTEERQFLQNFFAKLKQLPGDPWETVLCVSHGDNTLPKNTSLPRAAVTLEDLVPDPDVRAFYEGLAEDDW